MRWKIFVDHQPWNGSKRLFMVTHDGRGGRQSFVTSLSLVTQLPGEAFDKATLSQTREQALDGVGDVDGFLQAALEAAWELGMRPAGFGDHTNELKATRAHLEDMRRLALKGTAPTVEKLR